MENIHPSFFNLFICLHGKGRLLLSRRPFPGVGWMEGKLYFSIGGIYGSVSAMSQSMNKTTGVWKMSCKVE